MFPNTWSKGWYCSNSCLEGAQPSSFHPNPPRDFQDTCFKRTEAGSHAMHYPSRSPGREAKRERVETIVKGMSSCSDASGARSQQATSKTLSLYQHQTGVYGTLQNHHQFCKQDEAKTQDGNDKTMEKTLWGASQKLPNAFIDVYHEVQPRNYAQLKAEDVKLMKDVLKCELSKALSTSVDTIFKTKAKQESEPALRHLYLSGSRSFSSTSAQTEALSLVVRREKPHPVPQSPCCKNHELKFYQSSPKRLRERGFEKMTARSWCPLKVSSKVHSRAEKRLYTEGQAVVKNLPLSRVKQSVGEASGLNMFTINEGLTTDHLKKAKLMFFYTRYPSSFVLKMCFSDVQFTRCITSQLIKWFSNFREFFYIQMEKFARHAVLRGASGAGALAVGRESELFRVLNLHYNKTSDFQVPDRFLEVAEITLREFYIAICLGRDQDPSWKKAIYRVISKLDSEVPAHFILT